MSQHSNSSGPLIPNRIYGAQPHRANDGNSVTGLKHDLASEKASLKSAHEAHVGHNNPFYSVTVLASLHYGTSVANEFWLNDSDRGAGSSSDRSLGDNETSAGSGSELPASAMSAASGLHAPMEVVPADGFTLSWPSPLTAAVAEELETGTGREIPKEFVDLSSNYQFQPSTVNDIGQVPAAVPASDIPGSGTDDPNYAPTDITYSGGSVDENAAAGTLVATLDTVDPDAGDSHSYTLSGQGAEFFEIVGNEIRVKDGANLDFESADSHLITVEVTDSAGNTYSEDISIAVNNVNEYATSSVSDTDASANAVDENAAIGTSVGVTAFASDADGTDSVTYSLSDDA
ncbi:MAG: hypothetical protein C0605_00080, partial [Hyphomicrobiales bacterium]